MSRSELPDTYPEHPLFIVEDGKVRVPVPLTEEQAYAAWAACSGYPPKNDAEIALQLEAAELLSRSLAAYRDQRREET